jgi:hypothetical protein
MAVGPVVDGAGVVVVELLFEAAGLCVDVGDVVVLALESAKHCRDVRGAAPKAAPNAIFRRLGVICSTVRV